MKRRKKKEKIRVFVAISRIEGNKTQRKKKENKKNFRYQKGLIIKVKEGNNKGYYCY